MKTADEMNRSITEARTSRACEGLRAPVRLRAAPAERSSDPGYECGW